jgi:hypothetical protein
MSKIKSGQKMSLLQFAVLLMAAIPDPVFKGSADNLNAAVQEAKERRAQKAREKAVDSFELVMDEFEKKKAAQLLALRRTNQVAKDQKAALDALDRANLYFAHTGNPVPLLAKMGHYFENYELTDNGLTRAELENVCQIPKDWAPPSEDVTT